MIFQLAKNRFCFWRTKVRDPWESHSILLDASPAKRQTKEIFCTKNVGSGNIKLERRHERKILSMLSVSINSDSALCVCVTIIWYFCVNKYNHHLRTVHTYIGSHCVGPTHGWGYRNMCQKDLEIILRKT